MCERERGRDTQREREYVLRWGVTHEPPKFWTFSNSKQRERL